MQSNSPINPLWACLVLLFLSFSWGHAQSFWQKIYPGTTSYYEPTYSEPTADGGYIMMANQIASGVPGQVFKTDANGIVQWARRYSANGTPIHGGGIIQTSDGGYLVVGTVFVIGRFEDLVAVKLDPSGNITWMRTYGTTSSDGRINGASCGPSSYRIPVRETADGGFVFGNCTAVGTKYYGYLLKVNGTGTLLWARRYARSGGSDDWIVGIEETDDGGLAILVSSFTLGPQDGFMVVKTDAFGNVQWSNFYNNRSSANCNPRSGRILQTLDGGYLVCSSRKFGRGPYLVKLNGSGAVSWARSYNASGNDQETMDFVVDPNGDIVLACRGYTPTFRWRSLAIKVNSDGTNVLWARYYRPNEDGWADQVRNIAGGYMMSGVSRSGVLGAHMISMDFAGITNSGCEELAIPVVTNDSLPVFPMGFSNPVATGTSVPVGSFTLESPTVEDLLCNPLAGEEIILSAVPEGEDVRLDWELPGQIEVLTIRLERSFDLIEWTDLAQDNLDQTLFTFDRLTPQNQRLYYRLNAIDLNGTTHFSNVAEALIEGKQADWVLWPNPVAVGGILNLRGNLEKESQVRIEVVDALGRRLFQRSFQGKEGQNSFHLGLEKLARGPYWVQIHGGTVPGTLRFLLH